MTTFINVAMIVTAIVLILIVLLQARGGSLGGIFGGWGQSAYRTRRGIEKTLFRFTIILAVLFIVIAILSVTIQSA